MANVCRLRDFVRNGPITSESGMIRRAEASGQNAPMIHQKSQLCRAENKPHTPAKCDLPREQPWDARFQTERISSVMSWKMYRHLRIVSGNIAKRRSTCSMYERAPRHAAFTMVSAPFFSGVSSRLAHADGENARWTRPWGCAVRTCRSAACVAHRPPRSQAEHAVPRPPGAMASSFRDSHRSDQATRLELAL